MLSESRLPVEHSWYFSNLREVVLVPNRDWGGEGLLGCVFGFVPSVIYALQEIM
jgi:hypothetical protein